MPTAELKDIELSQKELLVIVAQFGLTQNRWENWERPDRGIMPSRPDRGGKRRKYTLGDAVYLGLVTVLADRTPDLAVAASLAGDLVGEFTEAVLDGDWNALETAQVYAIYELHDVYQIYKVDDPFDLQDFFRRVLRAGCIFELIHSGYFAMKVHTGIVEMLARREGFENYTAKLQARAREERCK